MAIGTPITGMTVRAATAAARWPDIPVEQTTTCSPRSNAVLAYSSTRSGLREDDMIRTSFGMPNFSRIRPACRMIGSSDGRRGEHPDDRRLVAHVISSLSAAPRGDVGRRICMPSNEMLRAASYARVAARSAGVGPEPGHREHAAAFRDHSTLALGRARMEHDGVRRCAAAASEPVDRGAGLDTVPG